MSSRKARSGRVPESRRVSPSTTGLTKHVAADIVVCESERERESVRPRGTVYCVHEMGGRNDAGRSSASKRVKGGAATELPHAVSKGELDKGATCYTDGKECASRE